MNRSPVAKSKPEKPGPALLPEALEVIERIESWPTIKVARNIRNAHPLVKKTLEELSGAEPDKYAMLRPWGKEILDVRVSHRLLKRAMRIMQALLTRIESVGFPAFLPSGATICRQQRPSFSMKLYPSASARDLARSITASWGIVGNYPDAYLANIAYNQNTLGVQAVGGQPVLYTTIPSSFGNDGIKPEQKREFEIGIEASFRKKRIELEASYYNAQIVDQILPLPLPATTGATSS